MGPPPGNQPHVYQFCSPSELESAKVGTIRCYCSVADAAGATKEATIDIQVLPPDNIKIETGTVISTAHAGPMTPMTGTHRFVVKRGNQEVGACLTASASEKIWNINSPEPNDWGYEGGIPTVTSNFYFSAPYIYDVRFYYFSDQAGWDNTNKGAVIWHFYQRVKVDVPKCDDTTLEIKSSKLSFKIIKYNKSKVKFVVNTAN